MINLTKLIPFSNRISKKRYYEQSMKRLASEALRKRSSLGGKYMNSIKNKKMITN